MTNIENQQIVLVLDALWRVIGVKSVKDAIVGLCGNTIDAIDFEYEVGEDGNLRQTSMNPVSWDKWVTLPVHEWNLCIRTANKSIRVPTVVIAKNFSKVIRKKMSLSLRNVATRDNWICQYTGEQLTRSTATIDHIIPKSKGGKNEWTNVALCKKSLNNKKGNKFNHEVGLSLIRKPAEPMAVPVWSLIKESKHREWDMFLIDPK